MISKTLIPNQGFDENNLFEEGTVDFSEKHKELIGNLCKKV